VICIGWACELNAVAIGLGERHYPKTIANEWAVVVPFDFRTRNGPSTAIPHLLTFKPDRRLVLCALLQANFAAISLEAFEQSGFNDSIRRTQCDHKSMVPSEEVLADLQQLESAK